VSGTHLGSGTNFFPFSLWLFLESYRFVDAGRSLWREVGSVVFSFCRASPAFLRSESHGTHEHILFLFLRLPEPGGPGSCIYFPQEQGNLANEIIYIFSWWWKTWACCLHNLVYTCMRKEFEGIYAYHESECSLEICHWCGGPCFVGAEVSLDVYLPPIPRLDRRKSL
jgi:hypothetical protein